MPLTESQVSPPARTATQARSSVPVAERPSPQVHIDYSDVTELPGSRASSEQFSRLLHRYRTARRYVTGRDVLEVGCGAGQGLGYLAKRARFVVGADYTKANLLQARKHYRGRANLARLDAHRLPFADGSFDVVLLLEAIYYLAAPEDFLAESHRVLRPNGLLLVGTVNKDWPDFNPSPWSVRYFSAPELAAIFRAAQFAPELFGAFPASDDSAKELLISHIKRTAVKLRLIPGTMERKELLKRIFFGRLAPIPPEIDDSDAVCSPAVPIASEVPDHHFKTLYAVGHAC